MPYISKIDAGHLENNPQKAIKPGQWNYLYTKEFIRLWLAEPSYATFHLIAKCVPRPESDPGVWRLTSSLLFLVKKTDLEVARTEALAEFRRRVMVDYENKKRVDKANVDPYKDLGGTK